MNHRKTTIRLGTKKDFKPIVPRTEHHCIRRGGHHGHVFDDGPPPTFFPLDAGPWFRIASGSFLTDGHFC
ncbi:MAG: peptide-methionine (R)-S-oxide reductase [Deltaproteobacteria bacterium]|nr:peptide-methionine (R)-S-oxide reductase [Deltaproteobacteria bacterium]